MKISVTIYNLEMFYGVYNQCRLISSVKKKKDVWRCNTGTFWFL